MISSEKKWPIIRTAGKARRALDSLGLETHERILARLENLQNDPFSGDVKKIKGGKDLYRLRIGNYRVYFRIISPSSSIEILLIDQRSGIKTGIIKRL